MNSCFENMNQLMIWAEEIQNPGDARKLCGGMAQMPWAGKWTEVPWAN